MTDHLPLPLTDPPPEGGEAESSSSEDRAERPRWYWPLFVAMLAALAVALTVWPIVVYQALIP